MARDNVYDPSPNNNNNTSPPPHQRAMAAGPRQPITVRSEEHYAQLLAATPANRLLVLNFGAEWAQPSVNMNLVVGDLAEKLPTVTFLNIDAEGVVDVSLAFDITAVPTFVIIRGGKELQRIDGANARDLTDAVTKYSKQQVPSVPIPGPAPARPATGPAAPGTSTLSPAGTVAGEDITARLKRLVSAAPVMLFMKGTPGEPRCQFSRKIVDLLIAQNVRYSSFDILADEEVRQALKDFSSWPTYPQLYVKGELVGGLDIFQQLVESGEFKKMIPEEPT